MPRSVCFFPFTVYLSCLVCSTANWQYFVYSKIGARGEDLHLRLQVKVCVSEPLLRLCITEAWKQDIDWTLMLHWSTSVTGSKLPVSKPAPLMQYSIKLYLLLWLNLAFQRFGKKFFEENLLHVIKYRLASNHVKNMLWQCSGSVLNNPTLPHPPKPQHNKLHTLSLGIIQVDHDFACIQQESSSHCLS